MFPMPDEYPTEQFPNARSFENWLEQNGSVQPGLWLQIAKKAASFRTITYKEAVDVALCFGWIDGQLKSVDAHTFRQKFTPRRKGSIWSKVNRDNVERLLAAGRMRASGLAAVEEAKQNGRWDQAYSVSIEPEDWTAALLEDQAAQKAWQSIDSRNRTAILFRIQSVKRAETRNRKIAEYISMLATGKTPLRRTVR